MHADFRTLMLLAIALLLVAVLVERIALKRARRHTHIFRTFAFYGSPSQLSGKKGRKMDKRRNYIDRARAELPDLQNLQNMVSGMNAKERENLARILGPEQVRTMQNAMAQKTEAILKRDEVRTRGTLHLDKIEVAGLTIPAASQAVGQMLIEMGEIAKEIEPQLPPHLQVIFQASQAQLAEHILHEASLGTSGFGFNVKELYFSALHSLTQNPQGSVTVETPDANTKADKDSFNELTQPSTEKASGHVNGHRR